MALLDAILQGSASKNNAQLRNLCARCVAQFAEWGLKQMSDAQIRDDPANIKSLVRRIQTHAVHPDPFKRLSALLCFGKLIPIIRQEDALIDNFILEIADCVLLNLKTSGQMHSNMGVSAFNISEKAKDLMMRIKRIILHKINLLLRENERRNIHQGLQQFLQFLLQRSVCSIEQDLRVQSQKLWEQCVTKLQQKKIGNKGVGEESLQRRRIINAINNGGLFRSPLQNIEDDQQDEQQAEQRRKRNLFNNQKENQPLLSFQLQFGDNFFAQNDKNDKQEKKINPDQNTFVNLFQQRNARKRKVIDKFRAQLQVIGWIVERNYLSLKEIATQDKETYSRLFQNIISFVRELRNKLVRTKQYPNAMIRIDGFRQQEAQSLIRSTYYSILQLYRFFISLSDKQLEQTILIIHNKVKDVDQLDDDEDNESPPIKKGKKKLVKINIILELSLNILLTPHLLGLELMMSQRSLERQLRNMVYKFMVKCLKASISNFTIQILSDFVLHSMTAQSLSSRAVVSIQAILDMPPNRFTQLCLGHLKLFELVSPVSSDYQLISMGQVQQNIFKEKYEGEWLKNLTVVCQDLIMHPSPGAQQKGRDLMKFIGKSMLPFDVLINWLTQKPIIFQRSADILLNYVASAWADQDYSLANKLFAYTAGQLHVNRLAQEDDDQQQEKNFGYQRGDEDVKRKKPNVSRRLQMLPLFIPFIQRLQSQHPLYCVKFWQIAPQFWNIQNRVEISDITDDPSFVEQISHQFRIYSVVCIYSLKHHKQKFIDDGKQMIEHMVLLIQFYFKRIKQIGITAIKQALTLTGLGPKRKKQNQITTVKDYLNSSLLYIVTTYFPVHSKTLVMNSSEESTFHQVAEGILLVLKISQSVEAVHLLFRVIRQESSAIWVYNILKSGLRKWIVSYVTKLPLDEYMEILNGMYDKFQDRNFDKNTKNNVRFGLMRRVIRPILKYSKEEQLSQFLVKKVQSMLQIMGEKFTEEVVADPKKFFLLIRQKIFIFQLLQLLIRKIPNQTFKTTIHQRVFGNTTKGNQITRSVISHCHNAKRLGIEQFTQLLKTPFLDGEKKQSSKEDLAKILQNEEQKKANAEFKIRSFYLSSQNITKDLKTLHRLFCSSAYACLATVILSTQTKQQAFTQFLFQTSRDKGQKLWQNMIDYEFKQFDFKVITSFKVSDGKRTSGKGLDQYNFIQISGADSNENLVKQYISDSFLTQNKPQEASALVYQTQPEQVEKSREEFLSKLQQIIPKQKNKDADDIVNKKPETIPISIPLELDPINSHPVMLNLLRVIDHLSQQFPPSQRIKQKALNNQVNSLQDTPVWIQLILQQYKRQDSPLALRLFFLKLVINRAEVFAPFASYWFPLIAEYISSKENGGKGLHYFIRDLCAVLLSWRAFVPQNNPVNRQLCTNVVNTLIKYSADKARRVFENNIQILGALIHKWAGMITVDKNIIKTMLAMGEQPKPGQKGKNQPTMTGGDHHLWRMNSIQILSFCLLNSIPVVPGTDAGANYKYIQEAKQKKSAILQSSGVGDPIIQNLMVNFRYSRKAVIHASAETFGVLLNSLKIANSPLFNHILADSSKILIEQIAGKGNQQNFISIVTRISQHFPQLLLQSRKLYLRFTQLLSSFSGTFRSDIMRTIRKLINQIRERNDVDTLNDVAINLNNETQKLCSDVTPQHQQQFLYLIRSLLQLHTEEVDKLLVRVTQGLRKIMLPKCAQQSVRDLLIVTVIQSYDSFPMVQKDARVILVHALGDEDQNIRKRAFSFWNRYGRLDVNDAVKRMHQVMNQLYVPQDEKFWLKNATSLVLAMAAQNQRFRDQIYVKPLAECKFQPLSFTWNRNVANRSQPMVPLFQPSMQSSVNESQDIIVGKKQRLRGDIIDDYDDQEDDGYLKNISREYGIIQQDDEQDLNQEETKNVKKSTKGKAKAPSTKKRKTKDFSNDKEMKNSTIDQYLKGIFGSNEIVNTQQYSQIELDDSGTFTIPQSSLENTGAIQKQAVGKKKKPKMPNKASKRGSKLEEDQKRQDQQSYNPIPAGMIRATQDRHQFTPTYLSALPQQKSDLILGSQRVQGSISQLFANKGPGAAQKAIAQIQAVQDQVNRQLFVASPPFSQQSSNSQFGSLSQSLFGLFNRNKNKSQVKGFQKPMNINPYAANIPHHHHQAQEDMIQGQKELYQGGAPVLAPSSTKYRKSSKTLSKFFRSQHIVFAPTISQQAGNSSVASIRHNPDGVGFTKQEIRMKQQESYLAKQTQLSSQKQITLFRKYRTGELPDIEITHRDLLMPLFQLVRMDSSIAVEVFVLLFEQIYLGESDDKARDELEASIAGILSRSKYFDYSTISALHRVVISLNEETGLSLDSHLISQTGKRSLSYQSAALLLEQQLICMRGVTSFDRAQKKMVEQLSDEDKLYRDSLMNLVSLYDEMGEDDSLKGVWRRSAKLPGFWIKTNENQGNGEKKKKKDDTRQDRKKQVCQQIDDHISAISNMIRDGGKSQESRQLINQIFQQELQKNADELDFNDLIYPTVSKELERERMRCMAEMSEWKELSQLIPNSNFFTSKEISLKQKKDQPPALNQISLYTIQMYLRSAIRSPPSWKKLLEDIEFWQEQSAIPKLRRGLQQEIGEKEEIYEADQNNRIMLNIQFCYELALISLTDMDFDRALYYKSLEIKSILSSWSVISRLSNHAKHKLVQRVQKLYELSQFLYYSKKFGSVKQNASDNQLKSDIVKSLRGWLSRPPSVAFDSLQIWDDVVCGRLLYKKLYQKKLDAKGINIFNPVLRGNNDLNQMTEIEALLYVQVAHGALKGSFIEASDAYMKLALARRVDKKGINVRITEPIMKVKTKQFQIESVNTSTDIQIERLLKLQKILGHQVGEGRGIPMDTQIKLKLLDGSLDKKIAKESSEHKTGNRESLTEFAKFSKMAYQKMHESVKNCDHLVLQQNLQLKQKSHYSFSKFLQKLLRTQQQQKQQQNKHTATVDEFLTQQKLIPSKLAKLAITHSLCAINLGMARARDMIPRLLDILHKYTNKVTDTFIKFSEHTPAWMFLRWSNQLMAIINRPESQAVARKVVEMTQLYPQALFYPFKLLESNILVDIMNLNYDKSDLFMQLSDIFMQRFQNLHGFVQALDCLVNPQHRFKYWVDVIKEVYPYDDTRKRVKQYLQYMYNDCFCGSRPGVIGDRIGAYNKKFSKQYREKFERSMGRNCEKVREMSKEKFINALNPIFMNVMKSGSNIPFGKQKLSVFSEWLANYQANNFSDPGEYIEIPGQYEQTAMKGYQPNPGRNIKIASFSKTILILGSIRRPKRLTLHGSDQKDYHLLVKGGEDLRLDQRIEQLFSLMNQIFQNDPTCANRGLYLKTFQVIPMTNRLGVLQWVDNTKPLKQIINTSLCDRTGMQDLRQTDAFKDREKWFNKVSGSGNFQQQQIKALNLGSDIVAQALIKHESKLPWDLLRKGLQNFCLTPETFLSVKNNFTKSYAAFAACSYVLGIGDRHLQNFLIDVTDGEILGIDFGIAFGSGVQLGIPEMVPFRMTRQIEGVIAPLGIDGSFRYTMIHAMKALRGAKNLILDCAQIFVKEPLLDWVKAAVAKSSGTKIAASYESVHSQQDIIELQWYPRRKLQILSAKLDGISSSAIMTKQLQQTRHRRQKYGVAILQDIYGKSSTSGKRNQNRMKIYEREQEMKERDRQSNGDDYIEKIGGGLILTVEEQIDCLIEHASDRSLIGKIWIGWSPYV